MDPTTPSDLRLEFSDTVPPEVLGLLIQELSESEPGKEQDLGIGGGPGILEIVLHVGEAVSLVVATTKDAFDLAERLRRWRAKCRAKGLPTDGDLTPFEPRTSDPSQKDLSAGSPDEQIRSLLRSVLELVEGTGTVIESIARHEIERLGEDTPEGKAWWLLAGQNPWSDWNRAYLAISDRIMAIRGSLTIRGLDSNRKDYVPLNEQDNT